MNLTINFPYVTNDTNTTKYFGAVVCPDVRTDLIIGLTSIKYFDLFPILQAQIATTVVARSV
jgi:hypothetical protein